MTKTRNFVAVLVLGIILGIAIVLVVRIVQTRIALADLVACTRNLRRSDGAKDSYVLEHYTAKGIAKVIGIEVTWADIDPYLPEGRPSCPRGGIYCINLYGRDPSCTMPSHSLFYYDPRQKLEDDPTFILFPKRQHDWVWVAGYATVVTGLAVLISRRRDGRSQQTDAPVS